MEAAMIWDLLLLAVLAGIVIKCWRQGLVSALFSLIGMITGYAGAAILSAPISQQIYKGLVRERLVEQMAAQLPEEVGGVSAHSAAQLSQLAQAGDGALEAVYGALVEAGVQVSAPGAVGNLTEAAQQVVDTLSAGRTTLAEAVVDIAVGPLSLFLIRALCFLILFTLISLATRFLVTLGRGVNHLPLIGGVNQLLGFGVGLAEAALIGYLATLLLSLVCGITKGSLHFLNYQILEETKLIHWISQWPILLS